MNPETELRDRLHSVADRAGHPSTDGRDLARSVAGRTEDRRRRQRNLLAAAGCVVLLGIAVPRLVDGGPQEAGPASGAVSEVTGGAGAAAAVVDVFSEPTRGSLADDRAFLDGVRALPWTEEPPLRAADGTVLHYLPEPPVESRRVVFAGDVPGGRWALVVGWTTDAPAEAAGLPPGVVPTDALAAAWFTGPPGASVDQMTLGSGPNSVANDWPAALTDPRTGTLVVVAAPGDEVQVSHRPLIDEEGTTSRQWRQVDTGDGVAVTRISPVPRSYDASTSFRVLRDGRIEARDAPWSLYAEDLGGEPAIEYLRGQPAELGEQAARYAAENVLRELGLSGSQVRIAAQWTGSVPAGGSDQAALVTVTLPSGAVVVTAQWLMPERPDGSSMGAFCGQAVQPAGPPAERRVHAVACEVVDTTSGAPMRTSLVVVAPPEVALIRTYDGDRRFLADHSAVDGVLVAPMPLGTETVEAVTAGGVTLGRVDVLGHAVDFGD
ncbi:hypothetical protein FHU33_1729 [Blastococcus colisei]|uniref:Uncharacterized protein n=1 Tax=Blastococcus colisei TaxID=1564162 RepID=A0A543PE21_9ACTN|nr:hypothetical protein [Blastococcus colisei]TQN42332.1 hypothetical protein FHU33_1729 [Blastococcus colisei]